MTGKAPAEVAKISTGQMRHMHAVLRDHGITGDKAVHDYINTELAEHDEPPVESRTELSTVQAARIIVGAEVEPAAIYGTLASALLAFQAELPTVHKSQTARVPMKNGGEYSYTYADLAAVTTAAIPLLNKHRMTFTCRSRATERGFVLVGMLRHISGETDEAELPLHGNSPQDIGGSITYGRRYLLGCMTGIVTEDDDDGQRAQGTSRSREWDGPSTHDLLAQIDADAARAGVTYEQATERLRHGLGGITIEQLDAIDPWRIKPAADKIHEHADNLVAQREAEAAAAAQPPPSAPAADTTNPAAPDDPWGTPS